MISADVICDYPISSLQTQALEQSYGRLIMVDNPAHHPNGDFALTKQGKLKQSDAKISNANLTFSGMARFSRALFEPLSHGKRPLRPVLENAIAQKRLSGQHYTGLWSDVGTAERLDQVRQSASIGKYIDSIKISIK